MRAIRNLFLLLLAAAVGVGAVGAKLYRDITVFRDTPFGSQKEKLVEVPSGAGPRQVVRLLARSGTLADEQLAWRYIRWLKRDGRPMKAGEYAFAGQLRPDEVLERVYRGEVKVYHFTVPEGLRMEEIAAIVEDAGLGRASELLPLMHDTAFARGLGVPFSNLEGYLYPDTYTFARDPRPRAVLAAMVGRFREELHKAEVERSPGVTLDQKQAVTLASIIEKETDRPEERPRISCVFHNRLKRGMRLQTDPTVMYATMLRHGGQWSQNISRADLLAPHPYNTYTVTGLPPGPICNPGISSIMAVLQPAPTSYRFFLGRGDGSHIFAETFEEHERNLQFYQGQ